MSCLQEQTQSEGGLSLVLEVFMLQSGKCLRMFKKTSLTAEEQAKFKATILSPWEESCYGSKTFASSVQHQPVSVQTGNQTSWDKHTLRGGSNTKNSSASALKPMGWINTFLLFADQTQPNTLTFWSYWQSSKASLHRIDVGPRPPSYITSSNFLYQKTRFGCR